MSRSQRWAMIDREEPKLSLVRQCALLDISRSSLYYLPTEAGAEDMELMALIDQQYLKTPFYGSRRMTAWLRNHGHQVNRKRVRRLMQLIGLEAIYRRPNASKPNPGHKVYPYLPGGWRSTGSTRCGPPTSPTYPWLGVSSTWWPSWTGTAATCWPGGCPTPWRWTSVLRLWKRP